MTDLDFAFSVAVSIVVVGSYLMVGFVLRIRRQELKRPHRH